MKIKKKIVYVVTVEYIATIKNYEDGTAVLKVFTDKKLAQKYSDDFEKKTKPKLDGCVELVMDISKTYLITE